MNHSTQLCPYPLNRRDHSLGDNHHRSYLRQRTPLFRWLLSALVCAAFVALAGCAPTTGGETKNWKRKTEAAKAHSTTWPGFKTVVDAQVEAASKVWSEAEEISDKEAKAAKMKEANEVLGKLVGKLDEVKYKSESVRKTITKINKLSLPKSKAKARRKRTGKAEDVLSGVAKAMSNAAPSNLGEALAIIDKQISALISAQGDANRAHKSLGGGSSKPSKRKKK